MINKISSIFILFLGIFLFIFLLPTKNALAVCVPICPGTCTPSVVQCSQGCTCISRQATDASKDLFTEEIDKHYEDVLIGELWEERILVDLQQMTAQLTAVAMQQVSIIGAFFDAKHQLETQRLYQQMTAKAHKDYHPTVGLCEIGTNVRSLTSSNRYSDIATSVFAKHTIGRTLLSRGTVGAMGNVSDDYSRLSDFLQYYCNPLDNMAQLDLLCGDGGPAILQNRDIDYVNTVGKHLTIDNVDFSGPGNSVNENALFALSNHLYAQDLMPTIGANMLVTEDGIPNYNAASTYLDSRALVAKRSVAVNSFGAIAGLKSEGAPESKPFIYAILHELSPDLPVLLNEPGSIEQFLGSDRPSYHAQMEVLTKKIYQNPEFYTELYDQPANVLRKDVAIQATELMQKRDIFRSLIRSEAIMAVMLEAALMKEAKKFTNEGEASAEQGKARTIQQ